MAFGDYVTQAHIFDKSVFIIFKNRPPFELLQRKTAHIVHIITFYYVSYYTTSDFQSKSELQYSNILASKKVLQYCNTVQFLKILQYCNSAICTFEFFTSHWNVHATFIEVLK